MTTVQIFSSHSSFKGFRVFGHSGYASEGKDIVCAAVSSAVQLTINGITEFTSVQADVKVKDGDISLTIAGEDKIATVLLKSFVLHMQELSKDFEEYLNIEFLEV